MKKTISLILVLFLVTSCTLFPRGRKLIEVFKDSYRFTGVAISKNGRIFLNYPYWSNNYQYAVVELLKNGAKKPYPNVQWNNSSEFPIDCFICVQSVFVDKNDYLWVLDTGNPMFKGVVRGGAKLVKIDLGTNKVITKYFFAEPTISKNSYLNDVRIDENNKKAFITDSGVGGIIVVDIDSGKQRKVLDKHASSMAEPEYIIKVNGKPCLNEQGKSPQIHSDGLTLDSNNEYLYYHALTGKSLYKVSNKIISDDLLSYEFVENSVIKVADTGTVDGLISNDNEYIFLSNLEENSIKYLNKNGELKTLIKDKNLSWPDSFAISPDSYLYVTDSRINDMPLFNNGKQVETPVYKLYKINVSDLSKKRFIIF